MIPIVSKTDGSLKKYLPSVDFVATEAEWNFRYNSNEIKFNYYKGKSEDEIINSVGDCEAFTHLHKRAFDKKFGIIKKLVDADEDLSEFCRLFFRTKKTPVLPFGSEFLGTILVRDVKVNAYDRVEPFVITKGKKPRRSPIKSGVQRGQWHQLMNTLDAKETASKLASDLSDLKMN